VRVRDYRCVRTQYAAGGVVFTIERKVGTCRCVACGSENAWRQGVVVWRFRTVPIGNRRVELEVGIPRLAFQNCGVVCLVTSQARRLFSKECIGVSRLPPNMAGQQKPFCLSLRCLTGKSTANTMKPRLRRGEAVGLRWGSNPSGR